MQSENGAIVTTDNLGRSFGARRAVDGISITVGVGEALVVFGPNGAGKTTLLRLLGGLLRPTTGKARISGVPLPGGPAVRRSIGVISHQSLLYDALTARENVEFAARLYGLSDPRAAVESAMERMRIIDRADTLVRSLSRGLRQRVSIARAIVHAPSVVLADEPFTGLDVAGAKALADLLTQLRDDGAALVLVTHNVEEGLGLATDAAIMNRGRIVRLDSRSSIEPSRFARDYSELVAANG